jgi:hypothetical protein
METAEFVQRWAGRSLTERSASQSHFRDLCSLLGVPAPTDDRATDHEYCYEARADRNGIRGRLIVRFFDLEPLDGVFYRMGFLGGRERIAFQSRLPMNYFDTERYWITEFRRAYSRRDRVAHRRWARRAIRQLRKIRWHISWMLGENPRCRRTPGA